jgi:hypothetical protein
LGEAQQYKFIRIRHVGGPAFSLDAVGIPRGHGGPENSTRETAFLSAIVASLTTVSANDLPGAAGAPNDIFTNLQGNHIAYRSTGLSLPALIQVNRSRVEPFTRTEDHRQSDSDGAVDQLIIDGTNESGLSGTVDTIAFAGTELPDGHVRGPVGLGHPHVDRGARRHGARLRDRVPAGHGFHGGRGQKHDHARGLGHGAHDPRRAVPDD